MGYADFDTLRSKFFYLKNNIPGIYNVLVGNGASQIITEEIIPNNSLIRTFLTLSPMMERSLSSVMDGIKSISESSTDYLSSFFYITQYGGSKTQFIHMVINEINQNEESCICINFEEISKITPTNFFNELFREILRKLAKISKFRNDKSYYQNFYSKFNQIVSRIHFLLQQSKNLEEILKILNDLSRSVDSPSKKKLETLRSILYSSILVDPKAILNEIIALMQHCTEFDIVFVIFFDEVDHWINDSSQDFHFNSKFLQREEILQSIFELHNHKVNVQFVFACTQRIHHYIETFQKDISDRSAAGSRLIKIIEQTKKIGESGTYGGTTANALQKISALYYYAKNFSQFDDRFFASTEPILEKKYGYYSRRICNSKIIHLITAFHILHNALTTGWTSWEKNPTKFGNMWQKFLNLIVEPININFIRKDIYIDPTRQKIKKKIDGYFLIPTLQETDLKIYVEIKFAKQFTPDKAEQAIKWLSIHPKERIIMVIFSPSKLERIKEQIMNYCIKDNFPPELIKGIEIIHIENPYAFCGIWGIENFLAKPDQLREITQALGIWVNFYGNFASQYQEIIQRIKTLDYYKPIFAPKEHDDTQSPEDTDEFNIDNLNPEQRTYYDFLRFLFSKKKFSKTGRMGKTKLQDLIKKTAFGISDHEACIEFLFRYQIITDISKKTVVFSPSYFGMSILKEFENDIIKKFKRKPGIL